ncbi:class I SAM-dependent methyltransferase [Psychromicrobium lacuslunae]|uniref:Methyltransferase domain-containing protein n=1 Tax=Psychromicrobium lacuslunae TaxID=1618207 RepID=A0A0D4BZF0_9MICC|nr:methyltransferase domain-containing protein [Psychromicrobium lacuslunae]AJT41500.1 hypothetical protein UM93_08195 [Psychromicrobium lacuslunae]
MSLWDQASSGFAYWQRELWQPLADQLVAQARLKPGEHVFDACCGTGSSAYPAALAVGESGRVEAVDLSKSMIDLAQESWPPLPQLSFAVGDLTGCSAIRSYDAVLCGFGLFFLGSPNEALALLSAQLRNGGRLVMSSWQNRPFEPLSSIVVEALAEQGVTVRASPEVRNIGAMNSAAKLSELLNVAGFGEIQLTSVRHRLELDADSGWQFVQGSLLSSSLPQQPAALAKLRERLSPELAGLSIHADALIANATKTSASKTHAGKG